ncbi:hypothetical protein QTO34_009682 [Cnephaeus nilssonii]|uniref:Uncharacterized protein n=1 Tax=Cnephaeus nilssonii TaxID=3371016 RepID=A0AA40LHG8_CNENI|nr:hypothetical protein QTO34_009682 [Eptesicus nilssonii]
MVKWALRILFTGASSPWRAMTVHRKQKGDKYAALSRSRSGDRSPEGPGLLSSFQDQNSHSPLANSVSGWNP